MKREFEMTNLGIMKYFLGIEVEQSTQGIFACQERYATNIMKRFKMEKWKPIETSIAPKKNLANKMKD